MRLALRTYDAPPWGCIVRVVPDRLTKSRKIPTRKTLPLLLVIEGIDIVNGVYNAHEGCLERITDAVRLIAATGKTPQGRASLASKFHLCAPPQLSPATGIVQDLSDWFTDAIETMPQLNYPYPVPPFTVGWPINETCKTMRSVAAPAGVIDGLLDAAAARKGAAS